MSAVNISSQAFAELSAQIFENASRLKSRNAGKYADTAADNDIIAESLRQILSGVAKRYLTRCSFAVPLLRKNRPWR